MTKVYVLWSYDADGWNATRKFQSIHATLEGAIGEIKPSILALERHSYGDYVKNYVYNLISEEEVEN